MMDFLKYNKFGPIGLDIGHDSIKMLQLGLRGGQVSVLGAAKSEVRLEGAGSRKIAGTNAIAGMYIQGGFRGKNVITCLSNEDVKVKSIRTEACDESTLDEKLVSEIAPRFGLNNDTHAIQYMIAGRVQQGDEFKNELLVFSVEKEIIKSHIEMIEAAGLVPVGIDTVPCAMFRSFERIMRRHEDKDSVKVYVDIGSSFTTVVVGRGFEISFIKQIPMGGESINTEIAGKLGIDGSAAAKLRAKLNDETGTVDQATRDSVASAMGPVVEQLAREISLCFKYYSVMFRGSRPVKAVFSGGQAYQRELMGALENQLGVEIEIAEPVRGFDCSGTSLVSTKGCEWAVAVGLSLKGWDGQEAAAGAYERN